MIHYRDSTTLVQCVTTSSMCKRSQELACGKPLLDRYWLFSGC